MRSGQLGLLGLALGAAAALPAPARASPYWVAWEGSDFPENEGWERIHYGDNGPSAIRSLADGIMTLDGLASIEIIDAYRMNRSLDPEPGEMFVAQWGLRVNEVHGNPNFRYDPGFAVTSDDGWRVSMVIGVTEAHSILEQADAAFAPGVFHTWEFRSPDMRTYSLLVDGIVIRNGTFVEVGIQNSRVDWGDYVAGATSHSDWDYFRFGVVPEPVSYISLLALLCAARTSHLTRRIP